MNELKYLLGILHTYEWTCSYVIAIALIVLLVKIIF